MSEDIAVTRRKRAVRCLVGAGAAVAVIAASAACTATPQADGPTATGGSSSHPTATSSPATSSPATSSPATSSPATSDPATSGTTATGGSSTTPASSTPPMPAATISVTPKAGAASISPLQPVTVSSADGRLMAVTLTNPAGASIPGAVSADHRTWTVAEKLGYGKTYQVSATAANVAGKTTTLTSAFTTLTPTSQNTVSIDTGSTTKPVGVGQIIGLTFAHPVTNRAAVQKVLSVTASPATVGAWRWMSSTRVEWRPESYWKPGTKVTVTAGIYGVPTAVGRYGASDESQSFTIGQDIRLIGSVSRHTLTVYNAGKVVRVIPVSYGKPATPTHAGIHVVTTQEPMHLMNSCSYGLCSGPDAYSNFKAYWAQRISADGEFLHAYQATVPDQGVRNVSHGCVNLSLGQAKWLFHYIDLGTPVDFVGGSPMLPIDDGYGGWNVSFAQWKAGS